MGKHVRDSNAPGRKPTYDELLARVAQLEQQQHSEQIGTLRESEARFRSLSESSPETIFVQSKGRILYANPAMASLLGVSRDELIGRKFVDFVAPEYRKTVRQRSQKQRETSKPWG